MITAILDTNVLASGFIGEDKLGSTPGELIRRWRAETFTLVTSEHILNELAETFKSPYFTRRLTTAAIYEALNALRLAASVQPLTIMVAGIASHAEDDPVLATALSARAPFLVTGDKPLLERGSYQGTRLLTPRQFLEILDREAHP